MKEMMVSIKMFWVVAAVTLSVGGYIVLHQQSAPIVYSDNIHQLRSLFRSSAGGWMFVTTDQRCDVVVAVKIGWIVPRRLLKLQQRRLKNTVCRANESHYFQLKLVLPYDFVCALI